MAVVPSSRSIVVAWLERERLACTSQNDCPARVHSGDCGRYLLDLDRTRHPVEPVCDVEPESVKRDWGRRGRSALAPSPPVDPINPVAMHDGIERRTIGQWEPPLVRKVRTRRGDDSDSSEIGVGYTRRRVPHEW